MPVASDPETFPVPLGELLEVMADRGVFQHLSVTPTGDGQWQSSFRDARGKAYNVAISDGIIESILKALAPDHGKTWGDILGDEYRDLFESENLEDVL